MGHKEDIEKLSARIKYLEETSQSTLDILNLMVTVSEQLSKSSLDTSPNDIFENTMLLINRFLPLRCSAFYLVNETNYAFELHTCRPNNIRSRIQKEINDQISDGNFAWATRENRPVILPAKHFKGNKIILHSLAGKSHVIGMFSGILTGKEPVQGGLFLDIFSIILFHCSQSLENTKLYNALKISEERYRELADMLPQTVFETDSQGKIFFFNRQGLSAFGLDDEVITQGLNLSKLFRSEDARKIRQIFKKDWPHPENIGVEYTAMGSAGTHFPVLLFISPIIYKNKHTGYRGIILDITERKKAETALHEREAMARALLNAQKDVALLVNLDGSIVNMNRAAVTTFKVHSHKFSELNMFDLLPPAIAASRKSQIKKVIETGDSVRFVDGQDRRIFDHIYHPIFDDGNNVSQLAIFSRDITETTKIEQERRKLDDERMEQRRLASIGLLTSGIAHNLKESLDSMEVQIDLLSVKHSGMEEWKKLKTLCDKMNNIIYNMMVKSRREQEREPKPINLNELIKAELSFLEADFTTKYNITKKYRFQDDLPHVLGRYSDFSQALMNIVYNAIDAMHDRDDKRLTVSTQSDKHTVFLTVTDTGCGIPKEDIPKLFTPYYTTKAGMVSSESKKPRSTGLGLYNTYKLLKPYGVKFDVQSKMNKGATFKISIPLKKN